MSCTLGHFLDGDGRCMGQGCAPQVGMQHDTRRVEYRLQRTCGVRLTRSAISAAQSSGGPARFERAASSASRTATTTTLRGTVANKASTPGSRSRRSTEGSCRRASGFTVSRTGLYAAWYQKPRNPSSPP